MKQNSVKYFIPSILWLITITVLSLLPRVELPDLNINWTDKLAHAFVYFVLTFLIFWAINKSKTYFQYFITIIIFSCITYSLIIEIIQYFIPNRMFDWYDLLANSIGVFLGYFTFQIYKRVTTKTHQ